MFFANQLSVLALAMSAAALPAPAPVPAPVPAASVASRQSSGKRGIAYNSASEYTTPLFIGQGQITWAFDWDSDPDGLGSGVNYIPLLWSTDSSHTDQWQANAQNAIDNGANTLFSFNEPDNVGQANMSPQDAADAWQTYMQQFAGQGVDLCAPAVTNGVGTNSAGIPMGFDWLQQFLDACSDCQIDCVNVHWYSQPQATQYFEDYINNATAFGKPVWLSEFAVSNSGEIITDDDTVNAFLESELPFLDNNDGVAGYAYFMAASGYLVENDQLSGYGSTYVNYNGGSTS